MGRWNENLYKLSRSHDQDGHLAHYGKNLLQNQKSDDLETWYEASMTGALQMMYI